MELKTNADLKFSESPATDDRPCELLKPLLPTASASSPRRWARYERLQQLVGNSKILRRLTLGAFSQLQLLILSGHKDSQVLAQIRRCRRKCESLLSGNEAFLLHSIVYAQSKLDGAMAEVGVFKGSSARIICEAKASRSLHLFDTFSGLPKPGARERRVFKRGQFAAPLNSVRALLKPYTDVHFHPGEFPSSASAVDELRFSFVHLDADLYASTLAGLRFFYPRMTTGGIILTHDYSTLSGVRQALAEFFQIRQERVIELPSTQAMVIVRH